MMNRRDFLLKTAQAGGAALAASLAGPVFGATRERLRLGMIGTGMRGQVLLHELLRVEAPDLEWFLYLPPYGDPGTEIPSSVSTR